MSLAALVVGIVMAGSLIGFPSAFAMLVQPIEGFGQSRMEIERDRTVGYRRVVCANRLRDDADRITS